MLNVYDYENYYYVQDCKKSTVFTVALWYDSRRHKTPTATCTTTI